VRSGTSGCARRGMRPRQYSGRCPTTLSRSSHAARIRRTRPPHESAANFLSPDGLAEVNSAERSPDLSLQLKRESPNLASLLGRFVPNAVATYLDSLNTQQRRAVEHGVDGDGTIGSPLLVIAGAGSGKTNTLAHRVAHLIVNGADPRRILLMTFSRR